MKKIVIIGAGPAGLTAAHELLSRDKNCSVTILEETEEIGGISRTVCHNGNRMDIGGHRFFSKSEKVNQWWNDRLPVQGAPSFDDKKLRRESRLEAGGPDPEKVDDVMLLRGRISRIYYKKKFFDYPISMKMQTFLNMGLWQTMKAGFSYLWSCVHKLPEDNLENFYINRFGRALYSMFFEGYTEKLWGRHPSQISADWGAQRVKGLSVLAILRDMLRKVFKGDSETQETSLIEEFQYPKFGPGQLWTESAKEIKAMGGSILHGARVCGVIHENGHITAVEYEKDGVKERMEGDIFLSSMPVKDLIADMTPPAPSKEQKIANGLPYRDFVTVGLLVNKLNLKNSTKVKTLGNIVPDCWIYVQDTNVKLGRIQIFNNWSPYLVKDPENTVWIGLEYFCTEGDNFWSMDGEECMQFAAKELVTMGILDSVDQVKDWHRERVKKAYPAYFDTYGEMDKLIAYLNSFGNLYCIGRNGQHRYNNMDHSMMTAFAAADSILSGKKADEKLWNINTEKEYHETSK